MKDIHIIWDWNGTLLDDFAITAQITIDAMAELGHPGITPQMVRRYYRRPLADYFTALLDRPATAEDIEHLSAAYAEHYDKKMHELPLAADARQALTQLRSYADQSLLSMAPHEQITLLIDHHGLAGHFVRIQGFTGVGHPTKRDSLRNHGRDLGVAFEQSWLIGDTVDDFLSAAALGIRSVLVTTGMQAREELRATGAPVVDSLSQAAEFILDKTHSKP
ncbi:HAD family hydrolase [Chelatococcus asaccharovorans]|uniref:HAD family hydrolase n=1 Tax=Chelatococcus asaccharovorans TaxID=28210 RepID=UPI00224C74D5|nr:HAD family hydrolase [Chelatococcus asaccharovorans]CAH1667338.1 hydrolase, haloacid dehalogenase-like family [Chelatococcus asaccharovorans]CAH1681009.1 hydrolase, haloacid dehalogenase-like family [Chelatococcus asaccharovorans]